MQYWLVKSPFRTRSWVDVLMIGTFKLYGIRNHQARNNIARMEHGDEALFYHGPSGKQIFGIMQVAKSPFPDPTTAGPNWLAVDFDPVKTFEHPVTLEQIKIEPALRHIPLVKQPRLSVMQLEREVYEHIVRLGGSKY